MFSPTWRRLARQPVAMVSGGILLALFVVGALAPHFVSKPLVHLSNEWINHPPTFTHWNLFGTDSIGENLLVRTLYGLHNSETTALAATAIATIVGIALGSIAGYRGGWLDVVIMRIADLLGVFPLIVVFLAVYTYFTPVTVGKATLALSVFLWIPVARVVRAEIASIREREFVQAALSLGASDRRIFLRHLLPTASGTIVIAATTLLAQVFVLEAMLDFFGLGVSTATENTLGNLIGEGQRNVFALGEGWWAWLPTACVLLVILVCANLFGDGVAEAMRPPKHRS
ncbi:MAG TPA: ABC transporter permease [Gaiellaceae bacterium]|nr:ABC transporter permease [Gaiellaceae bacterium]